MFLFSPIFLNFGANLSLNVLIKMVLIKKKECNQPIPGVLASVVN